MLSHLTEPSFLPLPGVAAVGIDLVEVAPLRQAIEQHKRFAQRAFTPPEIAYCESRPNKYESYAARLAAKEAVMKALGTGWDNGVQWRQIEVGNHPNRAPFIQLHGKAQAVWEQQYGKESKIHLSLSHCSTHAAAIVVINASQSSPPDPVAPPALV